MSDVSAGFQGEATSESAPENALSKGPCAHLSGEWAVLLSGVSAGADAKILGEAASPCQNLLNDDTV
jgi:hypothetical protein